jgi:hypothetical protein
MKRLLLGMSVVAAMLLVASSAFAGVNARWTNCFGDGGTTDRSFACGVNTGSNIMVLSFSLDADLLQASGLEAVVDFVAATSPMPAWWDFKNVGTCRTTSLAMNFTIPGTAAVCQDWAQGQASGGIGAYDTKSGTIDTTGTGVLTNGNQHRRLVAAIAVPPSALVDLLSATEYFAANVTINNAKTVGTGACAGCTTPVCIVFNSVKVTTPVAANDVIIGAATSAGSNVATWQSGPSAGICNAVPTRNATWGQVKALYR